MMWLLLPGRTLRMPKIVEEIILPGKKKNKNIDKMLTESTDATSETMIMIMEVLKWKIGTPHCKG